MSHPEVPASASIRRRALIPIAAAGMALTATSASGQTASFSRPTDTIRVPGTSGLTTQATYEAWVRTPSSAYIWNEWSNGQKDIQLGLDANGAGAYSYPIHLNAPIQTGPAAVLMFGAWHHIAYAYDGASERLYVDGQLAASRSSSGTIGSSASPIGAVGGIFRDGHLNGAGTFEIDSLRISRVARYSGSSFAVPGRDLGSDADTLLLYDFNECPGSTLITDRGPLARHGTLGIGFAGSTSPRLGGSVAPTSIVVCPSGSAMFSEPPPSSGGATYQWQLQTAPPPLDTWVTLGNDPVPLPCGGGAFAYASPINSPTVTIGVRPCPTPPGLVTAPQHFQIRCIVTNACGTVTSNEAMYIICPADLNCSGDLSVQDLFDFLNAYFAGGAVGDFNGVGGVTVQDIFDFLAAYFAGC